MPTDKPTQIIVFEDQAVNNLFPITIGRAAYAISCASYRIIDWLNELPGDVRAISRPHLAERQRLDTPELSEPLVDNALTILVNARTVPSVDVFKTLSQMLKDGQPGQITYNDVVAAAILMPGTTVSDLDHGTINDFLATRLSLLLVFNFSQTACPSIQATPWLLRLCVRWY